MAPTHREPPSRVYNDTPDPTLRDVMREVLHLKQLLTGGDTPSEGLLVRFDRVEVAHKRREVLTSAAILAAFGAVATTVWNVLRGHP